MLWNIFSITKNMSLNVLNSKNKKVVSQVLRSIYMCSIILLVCIFLWIDLIFLFYYFISRNCTRSAVSTKSSVQNLRRKIINIIIRIMLSYVIWEILLKAWLHFVYRYVRLNARKQNTVRLVQCIAYLIA